MKAQHDVLVLGCVCRVPTSYDSDSGVLTIKHTPECDACQYAYFAPYTYNRHRTMIARMQVRTVALSVTVCSGVGDAFMHAAVLGLRTQAVLCALNVHF